MTYTFEQFCADLIMFGCGVGIAALFGTIISAIAGLF